MAWLRSALSIQPAHAPTNNTLGEVLVAQGHHAEAMSPFRQAVELDPEEPLYEYNLGLANKALRRYEDAVAAFNRAIKLKPDYVDAYKQLTAVTAMGLIMKGLRRAS